MIGDQLQKAIYAKLVSDSVASGRIYDRVPENPTFPYVTIGDEDILNDGNTCNDAWTVYHDIHAWSRPSTGSKVEVKGLVASIVNSVANTLTLTGFEVILAELENVRTLRDPDGITEHAVVSIRYEIQPLE